METLVQSPVFVGHVRAEEDNSCLSVLICLTSEILLQLCFTVRHPDDPYLRRSFVPALHALNCRNEEFFQTTLACSFRCMFTVVNETWIKYHTF